MVVDSSLLAEALRHLTGPTMAIAEAKVDVPHRPGLYAVHGEAAVWQELGVEDVYEVWQSDPLFYPAKPPAHWLLVAEVAGAVLVVPLAPPDSDDPTTCRPIGCYVAATHLVTRYREDR